MEGERERSATPSQPHVAEEEEEVSEREGEGGGGGGEERGWMEVMQAEGGAPPPVPVELEVSMEKH